MKEINSFEESSEPTSSSLFNEAFKSSPYSDNFGGSTRCGLVSSDSSLFSEEDLYYEGYRFEDILSRMPRSPVVEVENDDYQKIVENQIDNIEPNEIFDEACNLKHRSRNPIQTIENLSEVQSSTQTDLEFRIIKRRTRKVNNPLLKFRDNPNSNMKKGKGGPKKAVRLYPKKEYYRTKLIRSWKRFIRSSLGNKIGRNRNQPLVIAQQFVLDNKEVLSLYAPTKNGPLTEGHGKRHKNDELEEAKTFNNRYVKIMFENDIVRESFRLFVIKEFYGKNCEELVERFDFSCCLDNQHAIDCYELWDELKIFSVGEMIN